VIARKAYQNAVENPVMEQQNMQSWGESLLAVAEVTTYVQFSLPTSFQLATFLAHLEPKWAVREIGKLQTKMQQMVLLQ